MSAKFLSKVSSRIRWELITRISIIEDVVVWIDFIAFYVGFLCTGLDTIGVTPVVLRAPPPSPLHR